MTANQVARLRRQRALDHIEAAQYHLSAATAELSPITGGASSLHSLISKMYDRVHALWYRVSGRDPGRWGLDDMAPLEVRARDQEMGGGCFYYRHEARHGAEHEAR